MRPELLDRVRGELLARREALLAEGDLEIPNEDDGTAARKPDEDSAPLTEMNQVIASKRNRARTEELRCIAAALARMAEDPEGYGRCEACDEEISRKRLALVPWATLCVECQQEQETDGTPGARRHLTDYR